MSGTISPLCISRYGSHRLQLQTQRPETSRVLASSSYTYIWFTFDVVSLRSGYGHNLELVPKITSSTNRSRMSSLDQHEKTVDEKGLGDLTTTRVVAIDDIPYEDKSDDKHHLHAGTGQGKLVSIMQVL